MIGRAKSERSIAAGLLWKSGTSLRSSLPSSWIRACRSRQGYKLPPIMHNTANMAL